MAKVNELNKSRIDLMFFDIHAYPDNVIITSPSEDDDYNHGENNQYHKVWYCLNIKCVISIN